MQRFLYSFLFTLALPLIWLRLLRRSRKAPAYRQRMGERFGRIDTPENFDAAKPTVWLHAVSVGESMATAPLVAALRRERPELQFVVTTMTPTGAEQVQRQMGNGVIHRYAPYDAAWIVNRFLRAFRPRLLILMETELWPNTIYLARRRGLKLLLANGRMSDKSRRSYARFPGLTRTMLGRLHRVCAQAEQDADRFRELGAERVRVTGSLKFAALAAGTNTAPLAAIAAWKGRRRLIVAASTRDGEEPRLLRAFRDCLKAHPQTLLLLVPRHPERFERVVEICAAAGFAVGRRSRPESFNTEARIVIGDSMGEMMAYFACGDIAFVGGSLVDTGCHNVLEPAALGLPVTTGPSRFNFSAICELLENAGALRAAADEVELGAVWSELLANPDSRRRMGASGRSVVAANQQALELTLAEIRPLLPPPAG